MTCGTCGGPAEETWWLLYGSCPDCALRFRLDPWSADDPSYRSMLVSVMAEVEENTAI
jgi:hypothetical protein